MTRAYSESYLSKAQKTLACMMDYAVHDLAYDPDAFFTLFLQSRIADEVGRGNPKYIAGNSGIELAREVLFQITGQSIETPSDTRFDRSPIYWSGWALAYYQWHSGLSFRKIHQALPFSELLRLYASLHEADISKFVSVADEHLAARLHACETSLALLRKARGLSQKALSETSGVSLRMIQLYEQKQNDIGKAQAATLRRLAQALGSRMEDLLE